MASIPTSCSACGKLLTAETAGTYIAQHGPRTGQRVLRGRCNECVAAYKRDRYAADPEPYRTDARADYHRRKAANPDLNWERLLRQRYGMTPADYWERLADQGGVCAACGGPPLATRSGKFDVDHCHQTGEIRGLLCGYCNRALGHARDDLQHVRALVVYLERVSYSPPAAPYGTTRVS